MATPIRWTPFYPLARFDPFTDIEDMLRGMTRRSGSQREFENALEMRMDINEDDDHYVVNVDMPGVKKEDIDISIEGNQVTLQADISRESSRETGREIYSERCAGQAYRSFTLPMSLDAAGASAKYEGGVLTLTLPKKANGESRRLPVS